MTRVPLVDLGAQHREVAREVEAEFPAVLAATSFVLGDEVAEFEREFARFCGVARCVGVANGTDALELALRAAALEPPAEVILPANSFVATAEAVVRAGAHPVLVDCDPRHGLIDVGRVEEAIGPRTRALLPVHLYGQAAPIEELAGLAGGAELFLLEDAAQAQGRAGTTAQLARLAAPLGPASIRPRT